MTKKQSDILQYIAVLSVPLFSIVLIILRTALLFGNYNAGSGYYTGGSGLFTAVVTVLVIVLALLLLPAIALRHELRIARTGSLPVMFGSAFFAFVLIAGAVATLLSLRNIDNRYVLFFALAATLFALGYAVYMVLSLPGREPSGSARGFLSLCGAFGALFAAMLLYFDDTTQMNHPLKLFQLLAFLALSLFCLSEGRHMLSRTMTGLHFYITAAAVWLTGSAAVPDLLYGIVHNTIPMLSGILDFTLLAAFFYALARLLQFLPHDPPKMHPMISLLWKTEEESEAEDAEEEAEEEPIEEALPEPTEDTPADGEGTEEPDAPAEETEPGADAQN